MRFRPALFLSMGLPAMVMVMAVAFGQQRTDDHYQDRSQQPAPVINQQDKVIQQSFPPNGDMETAWKVEWDTVIRHGLVIKHAWFKRSAKHDWMEVLGDTRVSELFVPYERGFPRFWDVTQYKFELTRVSAEDAGATGKLHTSYNGKVTIPCVVEEVKDRGVIWKGSEGVRRGHTLLLWGAIDAANYRYLVEYGFQDDGCITFRVGATGHNLASAVYVPHMHNVYWRIDINLDGKDHNSALWMEHIEPKSDNEKTKAVTLHNKFNDGKEGGLDWDPNKFSMLRIINTEKKNARNEPYSYDVMVARMGNSRHFGKDEECSQHDFWVTKNRPDETKYKNLPTYCKKGESIEDTDIVVWYSAPVFHEPRTEDGIESATMSKKGGLSGITHVSWSSFTLKPVNIFDRTPLYPYPDLTKGKDKAKGKDKKDQD